MSWVTIIWSMIASACLTLAVMHLLVWCRNRAAWANAAFALTALAMAGVVAGELWMMRAETVGEFGLALRWFHVPGWLLIVSLVGFVRVYLRAGRPWLAWAVCGVRTLSLILDFVFTPNLNYREITALRHIRFLGESVSVAEGVPNPWMLVGQAGFLLLAVFVVDAMIAVWRRDDWWRTRLLAGAIVFFVVAGAAQVVLALWGIIYTPLTPSLFFLGIVVSMAYEMSFDIRRAAQLSDDLRESEERMTLAAEATGVGVWMWSVARNQVWGSERWLRLFGFEPGEAVTFEKLIQRIHPDDRERVASAVRHAVETGADYASEYRIMLPDGTVRWIAARGRKHPAPRGKPARMLGASIDITDRKQSELETAQQRNQLAHLSRVNMLGELAGSLAPELNHPLTAVLSNAQAAQRFLAHDSPDLSEVRDILADIVAEDKRAGEVIHRLRLLLKKGEIQNLPLDVNEVVQEVLRLVRSDLVNQGFSAQTELAPDLPVVHGDRVQLQQVLINLVMNACDAMAGSPAGDRRLSIRTAPAAGAGIRVSVADVGVGLAPDKLEIIFEPFFTTKVNGMGLGLSVCRSIITAHGGKLWATNNPKRGATFHFTLPAGAETKP